MRTPHRLGARMNVGVFPPKLFLGAYPPTHHINKGTKINLTLEV